MLPALPLGVYACLVKPLDSEPVAEALTEAMTVILAPSTRHR